jgi:hypothetical protein
VFPWIGKLPITLVTAVDILGCLRRLEHQNTYETSLRDLDEPSPDRCHATSVPRARAAQTQALRLHPESARGRCTHARD